MGILNEKDWLAERIKIDLGLIKEIENDMSILENKKQAIEDRIYISECRLKTITNESKQ